MANPAELLQAASYAFKTEKDTKRAVLLAKEIVDHHPDSKEASRAKLIIDAARSENGSDEAYTEAQWKGAAKSYAYSSKYRVSRGVAVVIGTLGWVIVLVTIIAAIAAYVLSPDPFGGFVNFLIFFEPIFAGLLLIMVAELVWATLDNADNTGEMLALMKARRNG